MIRHSPRRVALLLAAALLAVAFGTATGLKARQHRQSVARGAALFDGHAGLPGRITGQSDDLPTAATRCVNCHAGAAAYAVPLDHATLTQRRSRRGGPASRFDEPTLCVLVRSGIDPAQIIIPQAMPRYDVTDQDCHALWDYLQTL